MEHNKIRKVARKIVKHSLKVQPNEKVFIDVIGKAENLVLSLIDEIYNCNGIPFLDVISIEALKTLLSNSTNNQIELMANNKITLIKEMDAYIGIREDENIYELDDIPRENYKIYTEKYMQPIQMEMAMLEKWVLTRMPTPGMAQQAKISYKEMCNLYYESSTIDYSHWSETVKNLSELLDRTEKVRIVAPQTDLSFSIKDIPNFICDGTFNLPDGEIFTAPVQGSISGTIQFNVPSTYMGQVFENVYLEFKEGTLIKATCNNSDQLITILSTDNGASKIGEFGIGLNPSIIKPTQNILFDEKMIGSIHLALGQAYPMADNGNESSIHLDLVLNLSENVGGGRIYFDDVLVCENGKFILPELNNLNN